MTLLRLALYQPDIPQNVGAAMRLCACLNVPLDIIEPCGFPWDETKMRRSGMDYVEYTSLTRHPSWTQFNENREGRLILLTTKATQPYTSFTFESGDTLLAGRESAGVPEHVHNAAEARIAIPMHGGLRSLNIVTASAMILGEGLRQLDGFVKAV